VDGPHRYLAVLTSPDEPLAVREVVVEADAAATTSTALAKPGADPAIDLHG
jgi:hypothetical protein